MNFKDIVQAICILRYIGLESITISKPDMLRRLMLTESNNLPFKAEGFCENMKHIAYSIENPENHIRIYDVDIIIKNED